ncbi:MAG: hypothetical protein ABFD50_00735 [Smithella sp.]
MKNIVPIFLAASLLVPAFSNAEKPVDTTKATYFFKNGSTCEDCRVVSKEWGATLLKPSLKFYYDRLLKQSAAGGEHFVLEKPDHTQIKVSIRQLKQEQFHPVESSQKFNLSTFSGERLKSVQKSFVDYESKYFVFLSDDGEKHTIPFQEVEYLVDAGTGQLLFNGVELKAKVTQLAQQSQQWNMAALSLQNNLNQQRALNQQEQYLRQQAVSQMQLSRPTTINCNTFGSMTSCTGW